MVEAVVAWCTKPPLLVPVRLLPTVASRFMHASCSVAHCWSHVYTRCCHSCASRACQACVSDPLVGNQFV